MSDYRFEKYPAHNTPRSFEYVEPATLGERIVEALGNKLMELSLALRETKDRLDIVLDNRPDAGAEDTTDQGSLAD